MQQVRTTAVRPEAPSALSMRSARVRYRAFRALLYVTLIILAVIFAFPFFWTVSSSLKTAAEWMTFPPVWIPKVPQWYNYVMVFRLMNYPYAAWIKNTVAIVFLATTGTMISSSLVAYGFARFRFPGKDLLFFITLGTMMIPYQVTLIPQFILFHKLGWIDTLRPLWVPEWFGGGAFNIFLMRQFFLTLPLELDEAARIDGAGYFRTFWEVLMPLCKPVVATVAIISFMGHWGDFLGPLVYLNTPEKFTISVGLRYFQEGRDALSAEPLQHLLMAATSLSIIPCIVVFFAGQRYFVRGIALTGIKG